jgi:hypothetical protein
MNICICLDPAKGPLAATYIAFIAKRQQHGGSEQHLHPHAMRGVGN